MNVYTSPITNSYFVTDVQRYSMNSGLLCWFVILTLKSQTKTGLYPSHDLGPVRIKTDKIKAEY